MLAERLLAHDVIDGQVVPRFLHEGDEPWLAAMLAEHERHVGQSRRAWVAALRAVVPALLPRSSRDLAIEVLVQQSRDRVESALPPARLRRALFTSAASRRGPGTSRAQALAAAAARLGVAADDLEHGLFADLGSERRLVSLRQAWTAGDLACRVNLALVQGLVARSRHVAIEIEGNARRMAQQAIWQGLICTAKQVDGSGCRLEISGPLSVVRHGTLYARALATLVPMLPWCRSYRLAAPCWLDGRWLELRLHTGAPIGAGLEPRRHDSALEAHFEANVRAMDGNWDVVREPTAVAVNGTLVFPDFLLRHRAAPSRAVLVEIAGCARQGYLEAKLGRLRDARIERLIVCIEARALRAAGSRVSLEGLEVLEFRRRVDVRSVLDRAAVLAMGA